MGKLSCAILGDDYCKHQLDQSLQVCSGCVQLVIQITEPAEYPNAKTIEDLSPPFEEALPMVIPTDRASRFNEGKPKWSLVHFQSMVPMIRVLEFGARKYAPFNWQKPMDLMEILESMQRHLAALFDGEVYDKESGISHMGHIQCNAMFYNYHKQKENEQQ